MLRDRPILYLAIGQTLAWATLFYVFPALLVRWETSLGWSRVELAGAITLAIFLSAAASPFYGRLVDAGHGPLAMALSAAAGGVGLLLLSQIRELWQFYAVWALVGLAMSGCLYDPCFALVTRARAANARQAIIGITLVAGFASTIGFPAAYALSGHFGWRAAVQVFAAAAILVAAPLLWLGGSRVERSGIGAQTPRQQAETIRRAFLAKPAFWLLALGFSLGAVVHGVTLQHLLPILADRGVAPANAVLAASFIGPMQVAGRLAVMAGGRRLANHSIAKGCFIGMGIAIAILMAAGASPVLLALFVVLFGGAYGTVSIIRPVIARDILGDTDFGAKYGVLAAFYLAGSAAAPLLGALVWRIGGYGLVLPSLVVLAALGLGLYLGADRLSRKPA